MMRRRRTSSKQWQERLHSIELLETRRLLAADWQNPANPLNVDDSPDGIVASLDAFLIINELNAPTVRDIATSALPDVDAIPNKPPPYYDVNGDEFVEGRNDPWSCFVVVQYIND